MTFFTVFSSYANSKDLITKDDVKEFTKDVIEIVANGEPVKALEKFRPYIAVAESEFQVSIEQLQMQQPMIDQRFGKTISAELIEFEEKGDSLMLAIFIQKFEKHIMRWRLYFYKPNERWLLNTYLTDDKIQGMFTY